jgi:hypothetical protein
MKRFLEIALHPIPEPEKFDTGLRYTDILFGFVIRELFLRLQNWPNLDPVVRWHLVAGTTLVLGSWIGFRRSLYRPRYQLKFVNLPLIRFLLDQLMLILYFRIAVLTPAPDAATVLSSDPEAVLNLAQDTNRLVLYVFGLYVLWDVLGIWMVMAKTKIAGNSKPRYPVVDPKDSTMTDKEQAINGKGVWITVFCLVFLGALAFFADCLAPSCLLLATTALLVAYRWSKEIRTSSQLIQTV